MDGLEKTPEVDEPSEIVSVERNETDDVDGEEVERNETDDVDGEDVENVLVRVAGEDLNPLSICHLSGLRPPGILTANRE